MVVGMEKLRKMMDNGLKPTMLMIMAQMSAATVNVLYKLASNDGRSMFILIAYRYMFATATVLPLALYLERNSRPKLTWMILCQAFFCGLLGGSLTLNLYAQTLAMTSASFASALLNLIPALAFIMGVIFRLEKLELKSMAGKAKMIGTVTCIGGAMLLTFYKGIEIKIGSPKLNLMKHKNLMETDQSTTSSHKNYTLGATLGICGCFTRAIGVIFLAIMSKRYPCHYSSTALISMMGFLQAIVTALCMERNSWTQWKLGWNIGLLSAVFSGVASGLITVVTMWCVRMKGPLFVSVFGPLILVMVTVAAFLLLNEKLYLGSILGAVVIVCGLYLVIFGKSKEIKSIPSTTLPEFDQEHQHHETIGTVETNKDTKGINVISIAPTT